MSNTDDDTTLAEKLLMAADWARNAPDAGTDAILSGELPWSLPASAVQGCRGYEEARASDTLFWAIGAADRDAYAWPLSRERLATACLEAAARAMEAGQ